MAQVKITSRINGKIVNTTKYEVTEAQAKDIKKSLNKIKKLQEEGAKKIKAKIKKK